MARIVSIAGHPLHPAVVHFPIVLLTIATASDVVAVFTGDSLWWQIAFWCIAAGQATALVAATIGFVDFLAIPQKEETSSTALRHMIVVGVAVTLYLVRLLVGPGMEGAVPPAPSILLLLSIAGAVVLLAGGWIGGTLVYRYGVGVGERHPRSNRSADIGSIDNL